MRNYCCDHKLSAQEVFRYSRQIILEEIGPEGQQKLKESSVLIIGAGPLGLPIIIYSAAAGIGRLGIVDDCTVGQDDLVQTFYGECSLGSSRIDLAERIVNDLNTSVTVQKHFIKLSDKALSDAVRHYDYVVDSTNLSASSRTNIAAVCGVLKKTLLSGVLTNSGGAIYLTSPSVDASSRCECCLSAVSAEDQSLEKQHERIFGAAFGFMGCLMTTEIIKQITSIGFQRNWDCKTCAQCKRRQLVLKIQCSHIFPSDKAQLARSSLLVVGAGGLGSPVSLYCAAAGINRIGLVDADKVAVNNLHRQIAYSERSVGVSKIDALREVILRINPRCSVELWNCVINEDNVKDIVEGYDLVADCSDNPPTRSLISDTCGALDNRRMVVSGSALSWDGQLTVYNNKEKCVCFRCLHPKPVPASCTKTCADNGVIGSVVGVIGCLQAVEILRILSGTFPSYAGQLFVYDGLNGCLREMNLKTKRNECAICNGAGINNEPQWKYNIHSAESGCSSWLTTYDRITAKDLDNFLKNAAHQPYLIDARPPHQFRIGHLDNAINLPLHELQLLDSSGILDTLRTTAETMEKCGVYIICRRGNLSQLAVLNLREKFPNLPPTTFKDIAGGYTSWQSDVDNFFPIY